MLKIMQRVGIIDSIFEKYGFEISKYSINTF